MAEVSVEPVVGVLAHRAGVEDDDVGGLVAVGAHVTRVLQQARQPLGVVHVHLAPVGADFVRTGHPDIHCHNRSSIPCDHAATDRRPRAEAAAVARHHS